MQFEARSLRAREMVPAFDDHLIFRPFHRGEFDRIALGKAGLANEKVRLRGSFTRASFVRPNPSFSQRPPGYFHPINAKGHGRTVLFPVKRAMAVEYIILDWPGAGAGQSPYRG